MRSLYRLTATIDAVRPVPTTDGAHVAGKVEIVSECDPTGRACMRCRAAGDDWHVVRGGTVDLKDPAELPFWHARSLSELLTIEAEVRDA